MNITDKALVFATAAHAAVGQLRKGSGLPYIVHPVAVAELIQTVTHTPEMVAAALLHDVVEDTDITIELIRDQFGDVVAHYVAGLTDVSVLTDGNRQVRKAIDLVHSRIQCAEVQTIKIVDIFLNDRDLRIDDNKFWRSVWHQEKIALVDALILADPLLLRLTREQFARYTT